MDLGLEVDDSHPVHTVLKVTGEVDVYTAPRLREKLVELVSQGRTQIVVDLEGVEFLDSTGLGVLVGKVPGPGGQLIPYREFVAPGLLAVSSMNGAMYDSTFNVFFRLKYAKLYDAVLATPMRPAQVAQGEIGWALIRGTIYAIAFMLVMLALGLVHSPWAVLDVPVAVLIGFAFAAIGMFGTTYMKSWQDFDYVILASMPLFLFSATFFPLSVYPRAAQVVIQVTPLYQGVVILRDLTVGVPGPDLLWRAAYLAALGVAGLYASGRRIGKLLLV